MAQQTINIGSVANDGTGDTHRVAFGKTNDNFGELYGLTQFITATGGVPAIAPIAENTNVKINGSGTGHVVIEAPPGHGTNKLLEILAPGETYPGKFEFWAYGGFKCWDFICVWPKDGVAGTGNDDAAGSMFAVCSDLDANGTLVKWFVNSTNHPFLRMYNWNSNFHVTPSAVTQVFAFLNDMLVFGDESGNAPGLKADGTAMAVRLDDDSGYADIKPAQVRAQAGVGCYGQIPPETQPADIANPAADLNECRDSIIAILDVLRESGQIAGGTDNTNYYTVWDGDDDAATLPEITFPAAAGTIMMRLKLDTALPAASSSGLFELSEGTESSHYPYLTNGAYISAFRTTRVDEIALDEDILRNQWHWVIVRDSAADGWEFLQAKDDGTLSSRSTQSHQAWNTTPTIRRLCNNVADHNMAGQVDRFIVSSDRWSDAQIQAVIAGGNGASNVLVRYEMSSVDGGVLTDESGNNNHATIIGTPTVHAF